MLEKAAELRRGALGRADPRMPMSRESVNREGWEALHPSQPPALWAPEALPG